jgi:hypothetical protein
MRLARILERAVYLPDKPSTSDGRPAAVSGTGSGAAESRQELLARLLRQRVSASRAADHPLSYNQRSLWFLNRMDSQSAAYNVAYAWRVRSPIDAAALRRAFERLVDRHAILRTVYGKTEPKQRVAERQELDFVEVDGTGWSEAEHIRHLSDDARLPFDLERGPVLRVRLFTGGATDRLLVVFHHIAYDLWSMVTLLDELNAFYAAESAGVQAQLPALQHQYADFVRWQADFLQANGDRLWEFWREYLAGPLPELTLPLDYERPEVQSGRGATYSRPLPPAVAAGAAALARAEHTTLFNVLLAAFQALLHQLSGQSQVVVGSPVAGRSRPEFENLIGYFLNTLPFRADASGDPPFRTFLARVRQAAHGVLQHQDYPLELLVTKLKPPRTAGRSPLFQALFVLNRAHVRQEQRHLERGGLDLELLPLDLETAQFELSLEIDYADDAATARWEYSTDLFEAATIAGWAARFERLLERAAASPDLALSALGELGADARGAAPRTAVEELVAGIYEEVLERSNVALTDPFVALGGTSLHAASVVNRVARHAGVALPVATLFELQTVERVAAWIEDALLAQVAAES